jgi:signal transduction histidine kinase
VAAYSSFIAPRLAPVGAWLRSGHDYDGLVLPRWINACAAIIVTVVAVASLAQDASKGRPIAAALAVIPEIVIVIWPGGPIWVALSITAIGAEGLIGGNSASIAILALLCPAGQAGLFTPLRRGLIVIGILVVFLFGHQIADLVEHNSTGWYLTGIGCIVTWAIGRLTRRQQQTVVALRQTQEELARVAVAAERERIARDVHDMVAHSLSVTMLHLTGARMAIDDEPDRARDALAEAERVGRASMAEIRRTVALLSGQSQPIGSPVPDASDLTGLIESYRRAGLDVTFEVAGQAPAVAPTIGLTLYRIMQESLANVAKHAPGQPAAVTLLIHDAQVELTVENPMAGIAPSGPDSEAADGGHGLNGMRQRAELAGGHLSAGERPGGRWVVCGVLPAPRELV